MKVLTSLITINGLATFKVLLTAETQEELDFLNRAIEKAEDFEVNMEEELYSEEN